MDFIKIVQLNHWGNTHTHNNNNGPWRKDKAWRVQEQKQATEAAWKRADTIVSQSKDFKAPVINIFRKQKQTMFKEIKYDDDVSLNKEYE